MGKQKFKLQDYKGNITFVFAENGKKAIEKARKKTGFIYYLIN